MMAWWRSRRRHGVSISAEFWFAGFDTPATFARFTVRQARVEVYRGNYASALTALTASFLSTAHRSRSRLSFLQHRIRRYTNVLFDPTGRAILAHPAIVTDAEAKPDGTPDARLLAKVAQLPAPRTVQDVTTDRVFTIYNSTTTPVPIIRNEELILLRAEARYFTNDFAGALADINFIRTTSGGLAPRGPL